MGRTVGWEVLNRLKESRLETAKRRKRASKADWTEGKPEPLYFEAREGSTTRGWATALETSKKSHDFFPLSPLL